METPRKTIDDFEYRSRQMKGGEEEEKKLYIEIAITIIIISNLFLWFLQFMNLMRAACMSDQDYFIIVHMFAQIKNIFFFAKYILFFSFFR